MHTSTKNTKSIPIKLFAPPASQTESSIAVLWDKLEGSSEIQTYDIYFNGEKKGSTKNTDYTVYNLESGTEYVIYILAVTEDGNVIFQSNRIKVMTKPRGKRFDITTYGAVGDGKTVNTKAIQRSIDACTPGGTVSIPEGTFLSGAIFLKSNMTLYIEKGGVLLGSSDTADYPLFQYRWEGLETLCYASLINTSVSTDRLENITIEGPGKIDANGSDLRKKEITEQKGKPGRALCLRNVDRVYLKEITVKQSPAWCVHLIYCNDISVNNINIYTKHDENGNKYLDIVNGDGLNPDSCSNVYIFNSMIASQDDCIAIKSGRNEEGRHVGIASENIRITNCQFKSGFGVAVGSEMSGSVRNVFVQDCDFENVYSVGSIKAPRGRGGVVENVRYEDCTFKNYDMSYSDCRWFRGAINIDQFYSHNDFDGDLKEEVNDSTPIFRDIIFKNIKIDTHTGNAIFMAGLPERPLKNIHLENIEAVGKYGFKAYNMEGLVLKNVAVTSREDENYKFHNVEEISTLK